MIHYGIDGRKICHAPFLAASDTVSNSIFDVTCRECVSMIELGNPQDQEAVGRRKDKMAEKFTIETKYIVWSETKYIVWSDQSGECIDIGADHDGLGLVEIRQKDHTGKVTDCIEMTLEQAQMVYNAFGQYLEPYRLA